MPIWLEWPTSVEQFKNTTRKQRSSCSGHGLPGGLNLLSTQRTLSKHTKIAQSPNSRCDYNKSLERDFCYAGSTFLHKSPPTQALGITKCSIVTQQRDSVTCASTERMTLRCSGWRRSHIVGGGAEKKRPTLADVQEQYLPAF